MAGQAVPLRIKNDDCRIHQDCIVWLRLTAFDAKSQVRVEGPRLFDYLHGGYGELFPRLEASLAGLQAGDCISVTLRPEEAYGAYDPSQVVKEPDDSFPESARKVGACLDCRAPDGSPVSMHVRKIEDGWITLDSNHPLAGRRLRFVLEVLQVRPSRARSRSLSATIPT